eukprot:symbB.v1.2.002054.t1/scaffold76.1/size347525/3
MAVAELTLWFAVIAVASFTSTFTTIAVYLWWRAHGRDDYEDIEAGRALNKIQRLRHSFAIKTLNSFATSESSAEKQKHEEVWDVSCAICLGELSRRKGAAFLPCGHGYHRKCLLEWCITGYGIKERKIQCPLCRQTHAGGEVQPPPVSVVTLTGVPETLVPATSGEPGERSEDAEEIIAEEQRAEPLRIAL